MKKKLKEYLTKKIGEKGFSVKSVKITDEDFEFEVEIFIYKDGLHFISIDCMEKWLLEENFDKYADLLVDMLLEGLYCGQ